MGFGQEVGSAEVVPFPSHGEVFADQRGQARSLRLAWHTEADVVVLSLWQADRCTGTFQLPVGDVPHLIQSLVEGLAGAVSPRRTAAG